MLEKPGGLPSRRGGEHSLGVWLPAGTKGRTQGLYLLGGREGHREKHFAQRNCLFSCFAAQPLPVMPYGLVPATQTQARWVSKLCVNRLSVAD